MTLTFTVTKLTIFGDMKVHMGKFIGDSGDTTGTITTGLKVVKYANVCADIAAMAQITVSESDGVLTLTFTNPAVAYVGFWIAIGY